VLGIAADLLHAALYVRIERAADLDVALRGEHGLRGFGSKLPAGVRRAGLHDHRPALRRTGDVERTFDGQEFALVVERVQLVGIEEDAVLDVADERIVGP
jgi:hypothetical protein